MSWKTLWHFPTIWYSHLNTLLFLNQVLTFLVETLFFGNDNSSFNIQNIWMNFLIYSWHQKNCLLPPKVMFSVLYQEKNIFMEIHICVFNPTAENLSGDKSSRFLMELFRQIKWGRWKIMAAVVNSNFPYNFKIFTFYQSNLGHIIFLYFHHRQKDTGKTSKEWKTGFSDKNSTTRFNPKSLNIIGYKLCFPWSLCFNLFNFFPRLLLHSWEMAVGMVRSRRNPEAFWW